MRKIILAILMALAVVLCLAPTANASGYSIGKPEKILGPSGIVDSLYATVSNGSGLHGYMSNTEVYWFDQRKDGSLANQRLILGPGGTGSVDQCGVHPVGTIYKDSANRSHWITFYHAERGAPVDNGHCNHHDGHTRWTIVRMESFDSGKTWQKGKQVITQDSSLLSKDGVWSYHTDDAGSPHLVIKGSYMYLFYRAVPDHDQPQRMSIARATLASKGVPGAWHKWYIDGYSQPGLGGKQTPIIGLPKAARGISYNTYLNRYISVVVDAEGIKLYKATDSTLRNWTFLHRLVYFGSTSGWGMTCSSTMPVAYGYGSIIGQYGDGARSGQKFWVYYMKKPYGECFDHRYLYRRLVTLG